MMTVAKSLMYFALAVALLGAAGCGATDKSCVASNSWAQPVWKCGAPAQVAEPEPEPEPEPIAEPEPEPEPEPAKVVRTAEKIEILEKVLFDTGSARIDPASFELLDQVARVLSDNPDITKVRVEGHTDNTGGAAINKSLSQKRAASVRTYLVDKGIKAGRLEAKGFGPSNPIADNGTADGRDKNRRVEFVIVKQNTPATPN